MLLIRLSYHFESSLWSSRVTIIAKWSSLVTNCSPDSFGSILVSGMRYIEHDLWLAIFRMVNSSLVIRWTSHCVRLRQHFLPISTFNPLLGIHNNLLFWTLLLSWLICCHFLITVYLSFCDSCGQEPSARRLYWITHCLYICRYLTVGCLLVILIDCFMLFFG